MGKPKGKRKRYRFKGNQFVSSSGVPCADSVDTTNINNCTEGEEECSNMVLLQSNQSSTTSSEKSTREPTQSENCAQLDDVIDEDIENEQNTSISHQKLANNCLSIYMDGDSDEEMCVGYRFMDMSIFAELVSVLHCPLCNTDNLLLRENFENRQGSASHFTIECSCGFEKAFFTSRKNDRAFDINQRLVYSMRSCGQGFAGIQRFCMLMNMPRSMSKPSYRDHVLKFAESCENTANKCMDDAADQIHESKQVEKD